MSVVRSLRLRRATHVAGRRRRIADPVDDDLEPVVAHADGNVAARDPVKIEPGGELAVDERVERQTRREVVIGHVERYHAAAAAATQVVVVVIETAGRAV